MADQPASIIEAQKALNSGGVIAYPTEACFGLGCNIDNQAGIERIRKLKSRLLTQGFIVVADTLDRLHEYIDWMSLGASTRSEIQSSWPGATSWLIPASKTCSRTLTGQHDTLAVRISAFPTVQALCKNAQSALVSTSANIKDQPPCHTASEVLEIFGEQIDYIVDLPIQGLDKPSQIIDARNMKTIRPA